MLNKGEVVASLQRMVQLPRCFKECGEKIYRCIESEGRRNGCGADE